jgi:type IV pilus assembly protein PilC
MGRFWKTLGLVVGIVAIVLVVAILLIVGLGYAGLLLLLVVMALYGWMLFAFMHHRQCRQEEFLQVLTAAAEAEAPLAPALWAYLRDQPQHSDVREVLIALLLFFVLPGYYWIVHRRANYDRKVEQVARLLEAGESLEDALLMTPGVASRETILAVALGEETGQMARCLQAFRNPARSRLANLWLEMAPRLAYPLVLLLIMSGLLQFWTIYIAPKYQRIFLDMNMKLPEETEQIKALGELALSYFWVLILAFPLLGLLMLLFFRSPTFRWYFPVVGHLYRRYVRSQILHALSFLLQMKEPAPQALALLAEPGFFVRPARRRLEAVRVRVERGEPLADSLRRERLLTRAMVPLLKAAERAGNLPWALAEVAEVLAQRTARQAQHLGMAFFPVPVVALGVLVGVIVIGLFVPLIYLIDGLAQ